MARPQWSHELAFARMSALQQSRKAVRAKIGQELERAEGIEPSYAAWEAAVLPLNYARAPKRLCCTINTAAPRGKPSARPLDCCRRDGGELPRPA